MSERIVEFYDSHPGVGGSAIPLPGGLKRIADSLSGERMTLDEALSKIKEIAQVVVSGPGGFCGYKARAVRNFNFIVLELETPVAIHGWRLIRFREIES